MSKDKERFNEGLFLGLVVVASIVKLFGRRFLRSDIIGCYNTPQWVLSCYSFVFELVLFFVVVVVILFAFCFMFNDVNFMPLCLLCVITQCDKSFTRFSSFRGIIS